MTTINPREYPEFRKQLTAWYDRVISQCDEIWEDPQSTMERKASLFCKVLDCNEITLH
jgi:hypothetical protein